ncbi:MAG TPA: hypothetical protein VMI92_04120 [Steroidobacteraceae bacterium]|nr:hypothetical protein [Steroidobacteraceae bacterium]
MGLWLAYPHRDLPVVPAAASAAAYLIAALWHPAGRYLRNLRPVEDIVAYIRWMRSTTPIIRFNGECFHHELRRHWVIETCVGPDGKLHEREVPRDEWERIVTLRPIQDFAYASWADHSAHLTDAIYRHQALCVDFRIIAKPADASTAAALAAARDSFIARFANHDVRFHFTETVLAAGFKPRMLAVVDMSRKSPLLDFNTFVLLTALGLLAPYLIWFEHRTRTGTFRFRKLFSTARFARPLRTSAHRARVYPKVYPRAFSTR